VIMTSNIGSQLWEDGEPVTREEVLEVMREHFRPEFINRIDEIVVFHALKKEHMSNVVDIQLRRVSALLAAKGYRLEVTEAAREFLAETGYDARYGARPLKHTIQRELQDPLALKILSGEFHEGDAITVDRGTDGLIFSNAIPEDRLAA